MSTFAGLILALYLPLSNVQPNNKRYMENNCFVRFFAFFVCFIAFIVSRSKIVDIDLFLCLCNERFGNAIT